MPKSKSSESQIATTLRNRDGASGSGTRKSGNQISFRRSAVTETSCRVRLVAA